MTKSENANATTINAIISIMNIIESKLDDIRREYITNDPINGSESYYSQLHYGVDDDILVGYRWILKEGVSGSLAQINGQETWMGGQVGDFILGILSELYKADKDWLHRPEYKILKDWRNNH